MIYDFLVIGAGLAGLKAAGDLRAAGHSVLVVDKSRGVSGRASTRRWDGAPVDHGAQFFTARSDEFRAQVEDWLARDVCFPWCGGFHQWEDDGRGLRAPDPADTKHPRYACHAGMSALGKDLAAALPKEAILLDSRVTKLGIVGDHWEAALEGKGNGEAPAARGLIMALPTPQALVLLKDSGLTERIDAAVRQRMEEVEYAPTLAVMVRGVAARPGWQGIQLKDKTLTWISDDTGKRPGGDQAGGDAVRIFMLHASPEFSREWQDKDLEEAIRRMVARAGELVGEWITLLPERQMHRWRFANVPRGVEDVAYLQSAGVDGVPELSVCGDAFLGAKIEGAYCSGLQVAKAITSSRRGVA